MRIQQLPPAIANQIAAGEVIERPASVVKELLENSFDAGATLITVEIDYGGLNQIKIGDNGQGIVAEDLPLALSAHATSKISKLDDLYAIDSMGFRGEALASIASVAKVSIISKTAAQEHATMLRTIQEQLVLEPCARTVGTTVEVADIFYNAPVRKRFLKSEKLEFQAIETVIKRFALSAPAIAITLKHNGKLILSLPAVVNEQTKQTRIKKIFGSAFIEDAVLLDVEVGSMRLHGWASGINYQRSQNDRLWVYINQRMVKDKLLNHAIKQAYDGMLHPGRFPACLLYFTINTKEVDVNVHPTKHEVRFTQPRLVHDFFSSHLTKALGTKEISDSRPIENAMQQVCEPSIALKSPSQAMPFDRGGDVPWVFLNKHYIILFLNELPYIVDISSVYQQWSWQRVTQTDLPLSSRPLLVPIQYALPEALQKFCGQIIDALAQLGLQVELLKENKLLIRSMPVQLPYLDIPLFFNKLTKHTVFTVDKLLQLVCSSQNINAKYLTAEERSELSHYIIDKQKEELFCKPITEEDCRVLLHV